MKSKINLYFLLLIIIVACGLFLRIYKLSEIPSGFFADEASIGYNAYSVLTTGKDEYQKHFPFFFRSFDDYKGPVYIYSAIPFIYFLGLNELSTRLPAALYGAGTIVFIYLLIKKLLNANKHKEVIALASSLFLTISPWHIHISRIAFEQSPFVFFTIAALYFFIKSKINTKFLTISIFLFAVSFYSYSAAKIFITAFVSLLLITYYKNFLKNKRIIFLCVLLLLFSLLPFIYNLFTSPILSRWQQVSIFSVPPNDQTIISHVVNNYLSHFSLDFLFSKGDIDMSGQFITRHSARGMGELYLFQLPLIVFGFIYLSKKRQWKSLTMLTSWLILYPLGSMFTIDKSAQATRSIIGVVPFQIVSAIGLYYLIIISAKIKKIFMYIFISGIVIIIFVSFTYFLHLYFVKYPLYSSDFWGWQYGARDIVKYFVFQQSKYDELIMAPEFNAPDIFFKFYAPDNCMKCRVGLPENVYNPSFKQLFAVTPYYLNNHQEFRLNIHKNIFYLNGTIAFQIGEIVQ